MKKLTARLRAYLIRRARDEQRKRDRSRRQTFVSGIQDVVVKLQGQLDLVELPRETREQLTQFERLPVRSGRRIRVYVDMREVVTLDACALLYVVAQVDRLKRASWAEVTGNYPRHASALRTLNDANFEEFLGLQRRIAPTSQQSEPTLQLAYGSASGDTKLDPDTWLPLHRWLKRHGCFSDEETDYLYQALGECVENVLQHAYGGGHTIKHWYAVALRPEGGRPARAVVLDLGIGIPHSIRRARFDRTKGALQALLQSIAAGSLSVKQLTDQLKSDDWYCIFLASQGLRTQVNDPRRGTGLAGLREAVLSLKKGTMHVISGESAVTWVYGAQPVAVRLPPLLGTIVCLEFPGVASEENEDG